MENQMKTVLAGVVLAVLAGGAASAATVEVRVTGAPPGKGRVLVSLCAQDEYMQKRCAHSGRAAGAAAAVSVRFPAVAPGRYVAMAFQDANGDLKLNRDWMGRPTEPWGFSGGPRSGLVLGPPAFDAVAVTIRGADAVVTVRLHS
jgi:uncharacterized protein (DUF2141 family)